jgi:hypothetical protein
MQEYMTPLAQAWAEARRFFDAWKLTKEQILKILDISEEVYDSWVLSGAMSLEPRIVARCGECDALHDALLLWFTEESRAYDWVQRPNTAPICGGRTAIETICEEIEKNPHIIRDITAYVRGSALY